MRLQSHTSKLFYFLQQFVLTNLCWMQERWVKKQPIAMQPLCTLTVGPHLLNALQVVPTRMRKYKFVLNMCLRGGYI